MLEHCENKMNHTALVFLQVCVYSVKGAGAEFPTHTQGLTTHPSILDLFRLSAMPLIDLNQPFLFKPDWRNAIFGSLA